VFQKASQARISSFTFQGAYKRYLPGVDANPLYTAETREELIQNPLYTVKTRGELIQTFFALWK
jgi:hypothetical protein